MFLRATFVAAAIVMAAIGSASPAQSTPGGCYKAASGDYPHATGTCHGHGGVQQYLQWVYLGHGR
jgi:hypothetical protein